MIALADCNNFYASCERVFNPALKGKPVVVLSNNDGCIIARSNESKALGIKMGEPIFKIRDKQNARDIVIQGELLDIISLTVFNENIKESESLGNEAILQFSVTNQDIIGHVPLGTPVEINIKLPEKTIFNRLFPYEKS